MINIFCSSTQSDIIKQKVKDELSGICYINKIIYYISYNDIYAEHIYVYNMYCII